MSKSAKESLHDGYVLGLLLGCKSLRDMLDKGFLPFGKSYSYRLLASEPTPHHNALSRRLPDAPSGAYLAVDLLTVEHQGERMQGIGRHYSSCTKGVFWGHMLCSSALVSPQKDPYLLRTDPFLNREMSTKTYPALSPSEAMLTAVGDVVVAGYELKGVLVDAQFTTRLALRSLCHLPTGLIGRLRTNSKVSYQQQTLRVRDLADLHPPGVARWYRALQLYIKRLRVTLASVGEVDLLVIWKAQREGWHLTVLISTLQKAVGIQELVKAWQARWSLEVSHRLRKQNLALGDCQCLTFAAQLQHAELVCEAFNRMRDERQRHPQLTWKQAQQQAAIRLKCMLTEASPKAV